MKNRLSSIQSIRKMTVDDENLVYVGGLPYDSTEDSIQRAFEIYGTIIAVKALSRYSYSRFASSCILIRDSWASTHVNLTSIHISSQNDYCLSTGVFFALISLLVRQHMAYLYLKRGTSGLSSIYVYFITVVIVHYWDSILGLKSAAVLLLDLIRYWSGPLVVPGARPNIRGIIHCIIRNYQGANVSGKLGQQT